jgi:hypothetical protein
VVNPSAGPFSSFVLPSSCFSVNSVAQIFIATEEKKACGIVRAGYREDADSAVHGSRRAVFRGPLPKNDALRLHIIERGVWFHILPFTRPRRANPCFLPGERIMRKLLILSVLVVLAAGATGCVGSNPCGNTTWRPGYYLFGLGRSNQPTHAECCDPCGAGPAVMAAPVMTAAPCCQ